MFISSPLTSRPPSPRARPPALPDTLVRYVARRLALCSLAAAVLAGCDDPARPKDVPPSASHSKAQNDPSNEGPMLKAAAVVDTFYDSKSWSQHEAWFQFLAPKGYRLVSLGLTGGDVSKIYAAVWVKKPGVPWVSKAALTPSGYQQFFNTWVQQGFRPTIIAATGSGANARFATVFEKDQKSFWARHGLSASQFKAQNDTARMKGYILRAATVYGTVLSPQYAGAWEQNTGNVLWKYAYGLSSAQYQAFFNGCTQQGYTPVHVTLASWGSSYLAICKRPPIGTSLIAYHGVDKSTHDSKASLLNLLGYTPISLQAGGMTVGNQRFAAVWVK